MPIILTCACGKTFRVRDEFAGRRGRCPNCGTIMEVPKNTNAVSALVEAPRDRTPYSPEDLYQQVINSVVGIVEQGDFVGSGFFLDPTGLFATNRHVVGTKTMINVRLNSGEDYPARVIHACRYLDLAFAIADIEKSSFVPLARKGDLKVGQTVFAIGHPIGLQNSLTQGIVSAVGRLIGQDRYIQTSAPINPGNSGGPLFNEYGDVVGMNTMVITQTQGIGLAIPADVIAEQYQEISTHREKFLSNTYCGTCGYSSPDSAYCPICGSDLRGNPATTEVLNQGTPATPRRTHCPSCKAEVTKIDRYCPRCGTRL